MNMSAPVDTPPPLFKSLTALRLAHTNLLGEYQKYDDQNGENTLPEEFVNQVETFLHQASSSGALLDIDEDRSDAQALLNYWTTVLYDSGRTPRPTLLARFDEEVASHQAGERCPYRGLQAFYQEDRAFFYGRRQLVREMTQSLQKENFLAVVGLSGSGKSSVVRAGLIPALQEGALPGSESWTYYDPIIPGPIPLRNLAKLTLPEETTTRAWYRQHVTQFMENDAHLLELVSADGKTAVVVVDQFEELFTLSPDDAERTAFVANLVRLAKDTERRHIVIITMRSEFDTYVARFPELLELVQRAQVRVPPLSPLDLRKAIEKPAERSGLTFEAGLVEELVQQVLGEPAGLPLLQFTLYKLWENREGKAITWATYRKLGGSPREALANVADAIYESFKLTEDRDISRRILLQLVKPGAGLDVTSNRVRRASLSPVAARDNFDRVLAVWIDNRLLRVTPSRTREGDQIEVMHEALIRNWPRLVAWVEEERINQRQRLQLTSAAQQWAEHKRDPGGLLGGGLLDEAKNYDRLNPLEKEFIKASEEAALAAEREKERHQQRIMAARKLQLRLASVFLVVALGLLGWAILKTKAAATAGAKETDALNNLKITQLKLKQEAENSALAIEAARNEAAYQLETLDREIKTKAGELDKTEKDLKVARDNAASAAKDATTLKTEIRKLEEQKSTLAKEKDQAEKIADNAAREINRYAIPPERVVVSPDNLGSRQLVRPLRPGLSIGSLSNLGGTLCCIVQDSSGKKYLLSADHIIGNVIGGSVIQPGTIDKGTEQNKVAVVSRFNKSLWMAMAELLPGVDFSNTIPGVGTIKGTSDPVKVGDTLVLVGRTSGAVKGTVRDTHFRANIANAEGGFMHFSDMILTEKISGPGDSGAPVLDKDCKLVGILIAGTTDYSIIIPIRQVLQALDVELAK